MKPIQLQIAGLHSYRDLVEIDFETLCAAGLFGIFGPTGSGKSTILDAITLALYGQVVRAGGTSHPQESLNQHEQRLFVSFTFELGHDRERKRYTIEREFGLDKKGKKRQPEVRLIARSLLADAADSVLESKATTATQAVEHLLGLTLNDFTRAVVLPQGQFSKFLTLKGSERNEMLQRIFHLHEYGEKLNDRIRRTIEQNKEELNRIEKELAAVGDAGPDALASVEAELSQAMEQEKNFHEQRTSLQEKKAEQEQLRTWLQELKQIEQQLLQLDERKQEMEALQERCRLINAAMQAWPQLEKVKQLTQEHSTLSERLGELRSNREAADKAYQDSESIFVRMQAKLRSEEPLLIEQKGKLAQALEWEQELVQLKGELTRSEQERHALEKQRNGLLERLNQEKEKIAGWLQEREQIEGELRETAVTVEERKTILALRERKQAWERELARTRQLKLEAGAAQTEWNKQATAVQEQLKQWKSATTQREELARRLAQLEAQPVIGEQELAERRECLQQLRNLGKEWRELSKELETWQEKHDDGKAQRQILQAVLKKCEREQADQVALWQKRQLEKAHFETKLQAWRQENMAKVLRETLHAGQECPVCGSTEHAHTRHRESALVQETTEQMGDDLRQQFQAAEKALSEADRQLREAEQRLQQEKVAVAVFGEKQSALHEEQASLGTRLARIKQECREWGEMWAVEHVDALLAVYKEQEHILLVRTEEREQQKRQLDELNKVYQEQREQELEQQRIYERLLAAQEQLKEKQGVAASRFEEAQQVLAEVKQALHELRKEMPIEAIEPTFARIEERDQRHAHLQTKRNELEQRIQLAQDAWQVEQQKLAEIEKETAVARERIEKQQQLWNEKHARWMERTKGERAADCLAQIEKRLAGLQSQAVEAERMHTRVRDERQRLQEALVQAESYFESLQKQRGMEEETLTSVLAAAQLEDTAVVTAYYQEKEKLGIYREQVQSYQTRAGQLSYDADRLADKLAGRIVSDEEYKQVCEAWETLDSLLLTSRDQVAVTRQTLSRIQSYHERWVALHAQHQDVSNEQSRLDELKRLFEGKAFVQFIAEEKLASIARDASYHLMQMTKNRYALKLGDGGEFVLRDEGAGGIIRPVSTLSGGETFLTSLALALALSVEIQMRGARLEFFFLDEGFGTLDPELLEVVLNALERLRMNDLTIGIISHVPELRVRMPRRLIVTPPEPLGAGSRIHLEME